MARGGLPLICMEAREKHTQEAKRVCWGDIIMRCSLETCGMIGLVSAH